MAATYPLYWIPLLPLLGAAANLLFGRRLGRQTVHVVACAAVGGAFVLSADAIVTHLWPQWQKLHQDAEIRSVFYTWISAGDFKADLGFVLDPLSAVMILVVTFVGFLIHVYSTGYMAHDPRYAAYFGYLNLFTGAMLTLVLADSLPVMFIGWEGVGVCSYLLIGFWFDKEKNANAGRKAFVVNRIGDFAFLLGIFLLWSSLKTVSFQGLEAAATALARPAFGTGLPLAFWAGLFLFIGACGKSAQIPLYVWLPDAMAGPTPVSALIHAATMVTAGVYMVTRLGFMYVQAPEVMMIVAGVGTLTALVAAVIGFAQTDIKKVLAYSTVSQLGFMFAAVGSGAFVAGIFHLFTHAFFKAGLFLGAGSVMHAMGDRTEIMEMGGLRRKTPITHAAFLLYCLAIAGFPLTAGFFSKDEVLLGVFASHLAGWPGWYPKLLWGVLSVAALGTAFYMWRLYFLVFWGECRADEHTKAHIHESPAVMTVPLVVLAGGAVLLGFLGVPHTFGVKNLFATWLVGPEAAAAHHASAGTTWGLMAAATVLGLLGIAIAWALYKDGPGESVRRLVASLRPVHKVVANKFYVDEIIDLVVVRPFRWIATATYNFVDRFVIDLLLVNGAAFVTDVTGRLLRFWQNGDLHRYFTAMLVGTAAILLFTWRAPEPRFLVRPGGAGTTVDLVADVGAGPGAKDAQVDWVFEPEGRASGERVSWTFPQPGEYKVSLKITDKVTRKTRTVTRTIRVGGGAP